MLGRLRAKWISDTTGAWLAVLSLVPWIVLTATGGGIHSHPLRAPVLAVTTGSAAPGAGSLGEAPRLQGNDLASAGAPCIACLWQLHSSASPPAPLAVAATLPAAACIPTRPACLSAADARSFDARAPPLS